jgi:hypothetical protein
VIEAVGPRAQELNRQAAEAHEQRYADGKEVDEWGMRLDRRGFDEAHGLLNSLDGRFWNRRQPGVRRAACDSSRDRLLCACLGNDLQKRAF